LKARGGWGKLQDIFALLGEREVAFCVN